MHVLQEKIGEGTYGKVYKAKCLETGRIVALKKTRLEVQAQPLNSAQLSQEELQCL